MGRSWHDPKGTGTVGPPCRFFDLPCYRPIQKPVNMGGAKTPVDFAAIRYLEGAMTVYRALPLVAMLVAVPLHQAGAQFGGMPGMPGSPGMPGAGFGGQPAAPPPACQQLLTLRDETEKNGKAIQHANERKASVQVACRLFKAYLSTETKFIKAMEDNARTCGVPPDA